MHGFSCPSGQVSSSNEKWIGQDELVELDDDEIWSPGVMEDKKLVYLVKSWKVFE